MTSQLIDINKPAETFKGHPVMFLHEHRLDETGTTVLIGNIDSGNSVNAFRFLQFTWDLNGRIINVRPGFEDWHIKNVPDQSINPHP